VIVALLLRHSVDSILQVFRVGQPLLLLVICHVGSVLLIGENLVREEGLVYDSVQHASAEHSGEVLLVLLGVLAWENADKLPTAVILLHSLVNEVAVFQGARLLDHFGHVAVGVAVLLDDAVEDLEDLRIYMVAGQLDVVGTHRRNLDGPAERRLLLVALVLGLALATSRDVGVALRAVLDFVETLLLTVEALELDHVKGISEQAALNCVIQGAVRTQTRAQVDFDEPRLQV